MRTARPLHIAETGQLPNGAHTVGLQALARRRGLVQQSVGSMGVVIDGVGQRRVLRYEVRCVPA